MEEETERLKEEERYDAPEMQLLTSSPRPGEIAGSYLLFFFFFHTSDLILLYKPQVDYGATADELEIHFNGCGPVNRVTILCDRFSGHPKGWVQFVHSYTTLLTSKYIYVLPKRTNMPGISTTDRGGHQGGHSRGRGRGYRPPRHHNSSRGRFRYHQFAPSFQKRCRRRSWRIISELLNTA
uniref:PABPN1 like, cytoplasmic n=1 Tax=Mastacembelus armatus TaxID=205130 RepID=A0A3Q3KPC5_9TELE